MNEIMWRILRRVGLQDNLVRVMESMYINTNVKISLGDVCSEWVYSRRWERQGCTLSPLLFSLYIEELAVRIRDTGLGTYKSGGRRWKHSGMSYVCG